MKLVASSVFALSAMATDIDYRLQDGASQIASLFLSDPTFNANVFNHGCWCGKLSSLPSVGLGGKAIDELDQICKNWNKARACTRLEGSNCYNQANDAMYEIVQAGSSLNCVDTDACLLETCQIDSQYAAELEAWWGVNGAGFNFGSDIVTNPTCESGQRNGLSCPNANKCYTQNYSPSADDFILGDNQNAISGYTNIPRSFYQSETGAAWLNTHYRFYQQYQGHANVMTDDAAFATADGTAIKFSNNQWMRGTEPNQDVSTFDFTACNQHSDFCYNDNEYINNYAAFLVGCGNEFVCSPEVFDWSAVIFSGTWAGSFTMPSIHVKTSLYDEWNQCLIDGFRSAIVFNVVDDGESNSKP